MPEWYGQQKEDELLWYLLSTGTGERFDGVFVDVGAHDGVQFSNTLVFEQSGWEGICVEPHPDSFVKLIQTRKPRCFNVAIGSQDVASVDFYITDAGMLSSLQPNYRDDNVAYYGEKEFEGWRKVQVPMYRLDTLLSLAGLSNVDFVSIDVEGTEKDVLAGFHPLDWDVKIVVLEIQKEADVPSIQAWFLSQGYHQIGKLSSNHFFSRSAEDARRAEKWSPERQR